MNEFDKLLKMAERYQALFPQGTRIELTDKGGTDSIPLNIWKNTLRDFPIVTLWMRMFRTL